MNARAHVTEVGPADGRPVLYFHSPATAGDELAGAGRAAAAVGLRLLTLARPSFDWDDPTTFVDVVAQAAATVIDELSPDLRVLLGWSGGAPYALATAALVGPGIGALHLVSPVPGPLTGPDAVADQTRRLQEVADTTPTSPWATAPAVLRDYQAVAAPWTFDLDSIRCPATIWAPTEDEITPPHLCRHLADRLPAATLVEVPGRHDWLLGNWPEILAANR